MKLPLKLIGLLIPVSLMAACATTANYEARLNTWVGQSESNLIGSLGVPAQMIKLPNGDHALVYVSNRIQRSGGYTTQSHSYDSGWDRKHSGGWNNSSTSTQRTVPLTDSLYTCESRYIIHNTIVISTGHTGNDCKSVDPKLEVLHQMVRPQAG